MLLVILQEAEKYLHPICNIYLLRLRSEAMLSEESALREKLRVSQEVTVRNNGQRLQALAEAMEKIIISWEYYDILDDVHSSLCFKVGIYYGLKENCNKCYE